MGEWLLSLWDEIHSPRRAPFAFGRTFAGEWIRFTS
jgi:hypothetical protein